MNANKFLPPPIRLSQAFDPEKFSGGVSGSEITRRSFLKRTGGATVATLVAWNSASTKLNAAGGTASESDSVSYRMTCTNPGYCEQPLWTFSVLDEPTKKVRATVGFASTCALYQGNSGDTLRDWNLLGWSVNGSQLMLKLEEQNAQGGWTELEQNLTKEENYLVTVNAANGNIERDLDYGSLIALPDNQGSKIAKWHKITRTQTGGGGTTNTHAVTVVVEIAVKGTVKGVDVDLLFTPCKEFVNGGLVDVPITFHSWVGHPEGATNTQWFIGTE